MLQKVLTLLLERHLARIQDAPPWWQPGAVPVDPQQDQMACAIATLLSHLEDRPQK